MILGRERVGKKIKILMLFVLMLCSIGCGAYESTSDAQIERPILVEKETDVVVTSISKKI